MNKIEKIYILFTTVNKFQYLCIQLRHTESMEVTQDYIQLVLSKVDSFFRESMDPGLPAASSPSRYVIKTITEQQAGLSYDAIWRTGEHLSATQLTDFLYKHKASFNFWDFQLVKVQSSAMCIIVLLNYYPDQEDIGIHCALPGFLQTGGHRQVLR